MRVLCVDSNHDVLHETLTAAGVTCDLFWNKPVDELISLLPEYEGLVIRSKFKLTADLLDTCVKMKCIGRVGAGMENIDVRHAASKNIVCLCVPEGNRDAVGEHALGMLLMLLNNLKRADLEVRNGVWRRAENRGTELSGKTVGIIGYGNMGSAFAEKLSGFGCKILAYDKYRKSFGTDKVTECQLEDIFEQADVVSLHVPLTKDTQHMVDSRFIDRFKKPVYVVNTARGKCLNTAGLVKAIQSGRVAGACLDVLEYESVSFEQIEAADLPEAFQFLIKSDKVILSPHIAGWTHESNYKMSKMIAEKMLRVLTRS